MRKYEIIDMPGEGGKAVLCDEKDLDDVFHICSYNGDGISIDTVLADNNDMRRMLVSSASIMEGNLEGKVVVRPYLREDDVKDDADLLAAVEYGGRKYRMLPSEPVFVTAGKHIMAHRIEALKTFETKDGVTVKAGNLGGYVERRDNLSDEGKCWIFDTSSVTGNAKVKDDAVVFKNSCVKDNVMIEDSSSIEHSVII